MRTLKILLTKVIAVAVLTGCASVDLNERMTTFDFLKEDTSVSSYIERYGPPFSVEVEKDGFTFTHYLMRSKMSAGTFIPVVNLLGASGNSYAVQRNRIKFDEEGTLSEVVQSKQLTGFVTMYAMPKQEGMTGSGGKRSQKDFVELGRFLTEKGTFFEQEKWKYQNVANNYFVKFNKR